MNILADNPVFQREARWGRRLRRLRHKKPLAAVVVLIALAVGWLYSQGLLLYLNQYLIPDPGNDPDADYNAYASGGLWRATCNIYLGLIVLLAPLLASSAISKEKEQQTWDVLTITNLTASQILVGKWLGRIVPFGWGLLFFLPLIVGSALAGADLSALPAVLAFFVLNVALYGMIGLLCSYASRKTMTATTAALTIMILLCLVSWVVHEVLMGWDNSFMLRNWNLPMPIWFNPFFVLDLLYTPPGYRGAYPPHPTVVVNIYWIASISFIALCFYYMFTRYRRTVRGGRPLGEPLK